MTLPDPVLTWNSTNTAQAYNVFQWTFTGPSATLTGGNTYFAATAYNTSQSESALSAELVVNPATNLAYRAAWGLTWAGATNPLVVVGTSATGTKNAFPRSTLYIRYGIVGGPDFPYQSTIGNTVASPPLWK